MVMNRDQPTAPWRHRDTVQDILQEIQSRGKILLGAAKRGACRQPRVPDTDVGDRGGQRRRDARRINPVQQALPSTDGN